MIVSQVEQLSDEWFAEKCGVIGMSHAQDLLTKGKGVTRRNYLLDVAAEIISGKPTERVQVADMVRGIELEPFAKEAAERVTGVAMERIGLAFLDETKRICASPDGILFGEAGNRGMEIKCPNPRAHMRYISEMKAPDKHMPQMQGGLWIFEAETWDFVSFCPEFEACPLLIHTVHRDEDMIERIAQSALAGVREIDAIVDSVGAMPQYDLGDIRERALAHLEDIFSDGEVKI